MMMQRTANEYAACERRICKRSDQPKINRIKNNAVSALHHCLLFLLLFFFLVSRTLQILLFPSQSLASSQLNNVRKAAEDVRDILNELIQNNLLGADLTDYTAELSIDSAMINEEHIVVNGTT